MLELHPGSHVHMHSVVVSQRKCKLFTGFTALLIIIGTASADTSDCVRSNHYCCAQTCAC